ncbi:MULTISPECIES: hypothetical protein [Bacillus]|nr:hypothetical protein [Bacillus smithii]
MKKKNFAGALAFEALLAGLLLLLTATFEMSRKVPMLIQLLWN